MKASYSLEHIAYPGPNGEKPKRPWVARIVGESTRYSWKREFLKPRIDRRYQNKRGTRGTWFYWTLAPGAYESCQPHGKKGRPERRLFEVTEEGEIKDLSPQGVVGRLRRSRPAERRWLDIDVLAAAQERIGRVFDDFSRVYVSFSGGKDSGVLYELAAREARQRGRRLGVLIVDLEAQYKLTIDYIREMTKRHEDVSDVYWVALPLNLRNAVSHFEPQWMCWDPDARDRWVREPEPGSITDEGFFPFFRRRMEFEEFVPEFGRWYAGPDEHLTCCLVGIRTAESLNRWRTIATDSKEMHDDLKWTTWIGCATFNAYPIYDWSTEDIWTFYGREKVPYNRLYDRMHQAGLSIHQQRICQPYGDDQRKGLWLYSVIEPETWSRAVNRVSGANFGSLYANESGNVLGRIKVTKPDGMTWEQYAHTLLESMPPTTAEHYRNKIAVFIKWWMERGYPEGIPDEGPANDKNQPSWTRVVKTLLRFDYHCKGLSFTPTKTEAYAQYKERMRRKREEWELMI